MKVLRKRALARARFAVVLHLFFGGAAASGSFRDGPFRVLRFAGQRAADDSLYEIDHREDRRCYDGGRKADAVSDPFKSFHGLVDQSHIDDGESQHNDCKGEGEDGIEETGFLIVRKGPEPVHELKRRRREEGEAENVQQNADEGKDVFDL